MKLSEKIVQLRKEKDWSQEELGQAVGISPNHISRYENGKTLPALPVIKKLAEVFNVSTDYLLFDDAPRESRLHLFDPVFVECLEKAETLSGEDKNTVKNVVRALLIKNQMRDLLEEEASVSENGKEATNRTLRKVAGKR